MNHLAACSARISQRATLTTNWYNLVGVGVTLSGVRVPKIGKKNFVGIGDPKKNCVTTNCVFWGPYNVKRRENTFEPRPIFFLFDHFLDLGCLAAGGQTRGFDHVWVLAARKSSEIRPILSQRLFEDVEWIRIPKNCSQESNGCR